MKEIKVICNLCGKVKKNHDLNDFHEFNLNPGYGSMYDNCYLSWDLCDECLNKLFQQFKYKPKEECY